MILINEKKEVLDVMSEYEEVDGGKLINGTIYLLGDVIDINAPDYVIPIKYKYDPQNPNADKNGFLISEQWKQDTQRIIEEKDAEKAAAVKSAVEEAEENMMIDMMNGVI